MKNLVSKIALTILIVTTFGLFTLIIGKPPLSSLNAIIFWMQPISIGGFIFMVMNLLISFKNWKADMHTFLNKFPFKSVACFAVPFVFIFILGSQMESRISDKVKRFLNEASVGTIVCIDRQPTKNPEWVINELKKIMPLPDHHSHATKRINIELIDGDKKIVIELGRDSDRAQEYWVFYPEYGYTSKNEIGRIITDIFDDYFKDTGEETSAKK